MIQSPALALSGLSLKGQKAGRDWLVGEMIQVPEDRSQPTFSVGYHVVNELGAKAFMKVTDLNILTNDGSSLLERAFFAMQSQLFERRILDHCQVRSMDRVVVAIDYGDGMVDFEGTQSAIFFLVFELAEGDLRIHVDKTKAFTISWTLNALHHLTIGVNQLHGGNVSHNDIKPANFLIFADDAQKIADLGCATSTVVTAMHHDRYNAGDPKYAAPEVLYAINPESQRELCTFYNRRAADLYNLGSMAYYLLTGSMLTPQILSRLSAQHRPSSQSGGWNGDWHDALPYWREAFGRVLAEASSDLVALVGHGLAPIGIELMGIIAQLCEPDSKIRGHPLNRLGTQDPYDLQRYISAFNRLKLQAAVRTNG